MPRSSSRDAADGEHAGDPPLIAQCGLKGDVDAGRPADHHGSIDAVGVHHREQIVGVVGDGDPRLVGGAIGSAETTMVPRHNSIGFGPPVDLRPGIVRVPSPLEISTGTPWPSLLHDRRRVPSTDVTDRYPNALPAGVLTISSMVDQLRRLVLSRGLLVGDIMDSTTGFCQALEQTGWVSARHAQ